MKVLITCGPTWVKLDQVRVISNQSTGATGHLIAEIFKRRGAKVTLIEGPVTHQHKTKNMRVIKYCFFDELAQALKQECRKKYDIIIHAAAVSDFKPRKVLKSKIDSKKPLSVKLFPTQKLINLIKRISPKSILVGFKLQKNIAFRNIKSTVRPLFLQSHCDFVVVNSVNGGYRGYILNSNDQVLAKASSRFDIARNLSRVLRNV